MNKIKAVIFDMDGLLIDTEPYWEKGDRALLASYGFSYPSDLREKMRGRAVRDNASIIVDYYKLDETPETIMQKRWNAVYSFLDKDLRLMDGAKELLESLARYKIPMAIATGGHRVEKVKEMFVILGIERYFPLIISGVNMERTKPHPEIYLVTAEKLGVEPRYSLVFEDAPNGVVAGKAAGMIVYGVNKDETMREKLKAALADKVFATLAEVSL